MTPTEARSNIVAALENASSHVTLSRDELCTALTGASLTNPQAIQTNQELLKGLEKAAPRVVVLRDCVRRALGIEDAADHSGVAADGQEPPPDPSPAAAPKRSPRKPAPAAATP